MTNVFTEARRGLRRMARNRTFTLSAVAIMALGIGANTAVFSVLNAVLLRSLPVRSPEELRVVVWKGRHVSLTNHAGGGTLQSVPGFQVEGAFPYPAYREFHDRSAGLAEVFGFYPLRRLSAVVRGEASTIHGIMVSGNFFAGYGAATMIGRPLGPEDDQRDAPPVAVITHSLWERRFARDPRVLGETLTLNRHVVSIVGVLSRDFVGPLFKAPAEVYVPFSAQPQLASGHPLSSVDHWWVQVMARLRPGADEAHARGALDAVFQEALRVSGARVDEAGIVFQDGRRGPMGHRRRLAKPFIALMVVTGLVLLIACANLAGLLLAWGASHEGDWAVRAAMGASRWSLIRESLVESSLLALAGALGGVVLAAWGQHALLAELLALLSDLRLEARVDLSVVSFAVGLAVITVLLFGVLPSWRLSRVDPQASLRQRRAPGREALWLGKALVVGQVAVAILLASVAGLLLRSFVNLAHVQPGFRAENVLLFKVNAGQGGYDAPTRLGLYERLREEVASIPGVQAVALSEIALGSGWESSSAISIVGSAEHEGKSLQASQVVVSDSFLGTMGIPLLLGRDLLRSDTDRGERVAVVNDVFVSRYLGGEPPLGRSFRIGRDLHRIVGVCGNATVQNVRDDIPPTMYLSHLQVAPGAMFFVVRSAMAPLSLVPAVRQRLAALDSNLPLESVGTQRATLEDSLVIDRLTTTLSGIMALLAALLSGLGLHGLMAFAVARRTREIGVRMALGSRPSAVSSAHLREALWLCGVGAACGIPLALAAGRLMRSVLFEVQPHDPVALLGAAALLLAAGLLAAWIPARRASKVDPMVALRCE